MEKLWVVALVLVLMASGCVVWEPTEYRPGSARPGVTGGMVADGDRDSIDRETAGVLDGTTTASEAGRETEDKDVKVGDGTGIGMAESDGTGHCETENDVPDNHSLEPDETQLDEEIPPNSTRVLPESDPCENIHCGMVNITCPDGYSAGCRAWCENGSCVKCSPDCSGHECIPEWSCSEWSVCLGGWQNRTCLDGNGCGTDAGRPGEKIECNGSGAPDGHVLFSGVMYDTPGKESDEEWFELLNPTESEINVSGWSVSDNAGNWTIPDRTTIGPGSRLVIARDSSGFSNLYGCSPGLDGFTRGLNNNGDRLLLKDGAGTEVDMVAWKGFLEGWEVTAAEGKAIKRVGFQDTDNCSDWVGNQEAEMC